MNFRNRHREDSRHHEADRKRKIWGEWATILVALPVIYVCIQDILWVATKGRLCRMSLFVSVINNY
ncbi:hypothetical protein GALMADRAFT_700636 [Galerina marginata CBS 339.88]|uniref:Uncharacterized protein n=1 Tax=Galerina marginata (strain CBS 339.88) TaxID=685588 RepID=A0A067TP85_GALM3|nr:hypothetical protein GALMADRAFT_700636 [Galerina marginata CBS 339.88]